MRSTIATLMSKPDHSKLLNSPADIEDLL